MIFLYLNLEETKEAITFWEFVGTCIKKSSTELDQWYDKKIKK